MMNHENDIIEFKQEYVPEIRKEVIAFANADGGIILIGVRKDGTVVGIEDPDGIMLQAANSLKDSIAPDVMPFVAIRTIELDRKRVVEIKVSTGTNRPYYIREKGLKPGGVYVRKGSSSQPMTDEGIREMIIANSGRTFESTRSLNQNLTFETLSKEMRIRDMEFGKPQMLTMKLIGNDGLYTNLAYLLSDQCETTTKVALFQGADKAIFRDRKEFFGSLLRQLEDVYQFLDLNNKTKAFFTGLNRTDRRDYPEEAVREALLNSITHRDYSVGGSNLINIYDDRIEFVSLGGLIQGLELESIFLGVSRSRNPNLAAVLYRMRLIESYGTGIEKIQRAYAESGKKPEFETAKGVFRVTLPNRNEDNTVLDNITTSKGKEGSRQRRDMEIQKELLLSYAKEKGEVTRKETEKLLDVGSTKAFKILKELCEEGYLKADGSGRLSKYVIIE